MSLNPQSKNIMQHTVFAVNSEGGKFVGYGFLYKNDPPRLSYRDFNGKEVKVTHVFMDPKKVSKAMTHPDYQHVGHVYTPPKDD